MQDALPADDSPTSTEPCSACLNPAVTCDRGLPIPPNSLDFTSQQWSPMARPSQNRKRQHADENAPDNSPAKRLKQAKSCERPNFSPAFWDNLSKVWLTPRALRELDRRNSIRPTPTIRVPEVCTKDLARFARHGGPDTSHLRGYPNPKDVHEMSSNQSSTSQSGRTQSTKATSVSSKIRKSSAYDDDFEQHLVDHDIYPEGYEYSGDRSTPEPSDIDRVYQHLADPRPSLSPSHFPSSAFKDVKRKNNTRSEGSIMRNVIPVIAGTANIPNEGNLPFTNLTSMTDETTVKAVPDFFDGARPGQVNRTIRGDLNQMIVPTKHTNVPVIPNFFLEAKAPSGGADMAKRQACYDGAHGARAMHALQNYGKEEPEYDGNAYTFSSTYHAGTGTLQLYAHHITAPTTPEGRPEYHMTQVKGYAMTSDRDTFVQGATAFRNARDIAKQHRDNFIQAANARASEAGIAAAQADITQPHEHEISTPHEPHEPHAPEPAHRINLQDADSELQQHIAETSYFDLEDAGEIPTVSYHHYTDDDSREASQEPAASGGDPSMSFTSSFTSGVSADPGRSKRSRQSLSPRSKTNGSRASKSRTRPSTARRTAESSAAGSVQSGPSDPLGGDIQTHRKVQEPQEVSKSRPS